jgi:alanyl-tRNA synthetase
VQSADNCSHVQKTDSIKDLVITEESSIAKGIRRVVAVTGHEANDISRQANEIERRLTKIEGMQGKEKDAAMKPFLTVSLGGPR